MANRSGPVNAILSHDRAERMTRVRESDTVISAFTACGVAGQPRCLKEYTFATTNQGGDLRKGKVLTAKRYNYPLLGAVVKPANVTEPTPTRVSTAGSRNAIPWSPMTERPKPPSPSRSPGPISANPRP